MRLVYLGSSDFALPALQRLVASRHEVLGVVTQPDRPRGRGRQTEPGVIHAFARKAGLPVWMPELVNEPSVLETLKALEPDIFVVASYGQKLSDALIDLPRLRAINIHASLLPRHRGASPIQQAILDGDSVSGVSVMYLADRIDAGDVLGRMETPIAPDETGGELHDRLALLGSELILDVLERMEAGQTDGEPQDPARVTRCRKIRKQDAWIDWSLPPPQQHDFIRAYWPWPKAYAIRDHGGRERRVSFRASRLIEGSSDPDAGGTLLEVDPSGIVIATGGGRLALTRLQLEGGRELPVKELLLGNAIEVGERWIGRSELPGAEY
ncbi:MAG: methionyl-tRNA formyltransferase [Planctomycetota bacterium]